MEFLQFPRLHHYNKKAQNSLSNHPKIKNYKTDHKKISGKIFNIQQLTQFTIS